MCSEAATIPIEGCLSKHKFIQREKEPELVILTQKQAPRTMFLQFYHRTILLELLLNRARLHVELTVELGSIITW